MDKNEYNLKLEEINRYVDQGNYAEAARVADEIDWKRVRNVRTLCLVSEIYEAEGRYDDSKSILLRAYKRSPIGRTVLYRLVEVTIALKQFDEAIEYYSEYIQAAPHDNSRYILKYKIYKGRGSSVEEQIDILKEYLDQEYSDQYAYELAKLYQQADRIQECLATCDDLVLWFHSGKYVIKALELKKRYSPLTPKQQEIYDHRNDQLDDPLERLGEEKTIVDTGDVTLAETIMEDTEKQIADEVAKAAADLDRDLSMEPSPAPGQLGSDTRIVDDLTKKEPAKAEGSVSGDTIIYSGVYEKEESAEAKAEQADAAASAGAAESAAEGTDEARTRVSTAEDSVSAADFSGEAGAAAGMAAGTAGEYAGPAAGSIGEAAASAAAGLAGAAAGMTGLTGGSGETDRTGGAGFKGSSLPEQEPVSIERTRVYDAESIRNAAGARIDDVLAEMKAGREQAERRIADSLTGRPEAADSAAANPSEYENIPDDGGNSLADAGSVLSAEAGTEGLADTSPAAMTQSAQSAVTEAEEIAGIQTPAAEPEKPLSAEELQSRMAKSMRSIVSGVGIRDYVDEDEEAVDRLIEESKKDQEAAQAAKEADTGISLSKRLSVPELQQKKAAGQLSIDDILLSMGERGSAVREAAAKVKQPTSQPAGVLSALDEALLNMGVPLEAQQAAREAEQKEREIREEAARQLDEIAQEENLLTRDTGDLSLAEERRASLEAARRRVEEAGKAVSDKAEETVREAKKDAAGSAAEDGAQTAEDDAVSRQAAAMTAEVSDEISKAVGEIMGEPESVFGASADEAVTKAAYQAAAKADEAVTEAAYRPAAQAGEAVTEAAYQAAAKADEAVTEAAYRPAAQAGEAVTEAAYQAAVKADDAVTEAIPRPAAAPGGADGDVTLAKPVQHEEPGSAAEKASTNQKMSMSQIIKAKTRKIPTEEIDQKYDSGKVQESEQAQHWLKPYQRELFEGYLGIRNMERQISYAIDQALAKGADRTSRTGNVLIFGGHGCGKSTIATGLAKAIAQERGKQSVKMAKIYATDLNRKDIAATIAKISGGVLIIEEAGDLEDATADQLTTAMEFRTDGLIIMMEDEQKYLHELLMRHPRLTMKFTSQIYIPVFSMDELIGFGNLYATDQGYAFSEGAVTALAGRLSGLAQQGEAISITDVLDFVDAAMKRANTFGRRVFGGKKRYDESGRVILTDKDFR